MSGAPETKTWDDPSSLCTTGKRPILLTGIFLQLLQRHFGSEANITERALKPYIWHPDKQKTQIVIEPNIRVDWQLIEYRPAIIVKRDALRSHKLAIDDFKEPATRIGEGDHYVRGRVGSHTLFCIADNGGIAELLGQEVADELMQFSPLIRQDLAFNRFEEAQVGEVMQVEESDTHFVVPVFVAYAFVAEWQLTPEQPWLKAFSAAYQ